MDELIPVSLAIRAVERAIRECDAATPGPWAADCVDPTDVMVWAPATDGAPFSVPSDENERAIFQLGSWLVAAGSVGDKKDAVNAVFVVLARAGFRASLEYLYRFLRIAGSLELRYVSSHQAAAVAPLIAHYDAVQPGWRTE